MKKAPISTRARFKMAAAEIQRMEDDTQRLRESLISARREIDEWERAMRAERESPTSILVEVKEANEEDGFPAYAVVRFGANGVPIYTRKEALALAKKLTRIAEKLPTRSKGR